MTKDLFIAEYERLEAEALDRGLTQAQAQKFAEDNAYDAMCERLFDRADRERKIRRGE